jgi:hypothetical protein
MSYKHYYKSSLTALVISATVSFAPASSAALAAYGQNFEGMTPNQGFSDPDIPFVNDLDADGWQIYGIVYDTNPYTGPATITGQYGSYPAANGEPGGSIQGVATGQGGPSQGDVVLAKYTDYNNQDGLATGYVSASTYQEQTVGAGDVGNIWRFSYDAKIGNLENDSSAFAYMLSQDFTNGEEIFLSNDSTNLPIEWFRYSIDLLITQTMVGDNLSFGFGATATGNNGSGVFYDNLSFAEVAPVPVPAAVWLFGSGLVGLVGVARRRKHRQLKLCSFK